MSLRLLFITGVALLAVSPFAREVSRGTGLEGVTPRARVVMLSRDAPGMPANCSPAYPGRCIPPPPPDLDCADIPAKNFTVLPPDPHHFDSDNDGKGCES